MNKENNEIRNQLTEHKRNYRLINPILLEAYCSMHPARLTKLCMIMFNYLLATKKNHKPESRFFDINEDKRIYTNMVITADDFLERINPSKYFLEKRETETDVATIVKYFNEIDDLNIFYMWKFGSPKIHMFILERDIGVWKYFNPKAYVIPKTMTKIISSANGMIDSMVNMTEQAKQSYGRNDIEKSFGEFINRMWTKMSPSIIDQSPKWDYEQSVDMNVYNISKYLKSLDPYEGLEEDGSFLLRLPQSITKKLKFIKSAEKKTATFDIDLQNELVPDDDDVIRKVKTRTRKAKDITDIDDSPDPNLVSFTPLDPFKGANEFVRFYKGILRSVNNKFCFFDSELEFEYANQIMDMLDTTSHKNDVKFLRSWIRYYALQFKGASIYQKDKTSLKAFAKTYIIYNSKYAG